MRAQAQPPRGRPGRCVRSSLRSSLASPQACRSRLLRRRRRRRRRAVGGVACSLCAWWPARAPMANDACSAPPAVGRISTPSRGFCLCEWSTQIVVRLRSRVGGDDGSKNPGVFFLCSPSWRDRSALPLQHHSVVWCLSSAINHMAKRRITRAVCTVAVSDKALSRTACLCPNGRSPTTAAPNGKHGQ